MAVELAPSMNDWITKLQDDIRRRNLGPEEVCARLQQKYDADGLPMTGGEQNFKDFSKIIIAASRQNIPIVGIDGRQDVPGFGNKLLEMLNSHETKLNDLIDQIYSMDGQNAQRAVNLLNNQGDGNRIAIMQGVGHACERERQPRLAEYLKKQGVSVTTIALNPPEMIPCAHPPAISVDAGNLDNDISARESNRSTAKTGPYEKASHARSLMVPH